MPNAELEGCNGIKRPDCGELMGLQAALVRCYHHVTARWKENMEGENESLSEMIRTLISATQDRRMCRQEGVQWEEDKRG